MADTEDGPRVRSTSTALFLCDTSPRPIRMASSLASVSAETGTTSTAWAPLLEPEARIWLSTALNDVNTGPMRPVLLPWGSLRGRAAAAARCRGRAGLLGAANNFEGRWARSMVAPPAPPRPGLRRALRRALGSLVASAACARRGSWRRRQRQRRAPAALPPRPRRRANASWPFGERPCRHFVLPVRHNGGHRLLAVVPLACGSRLPELADTPQPARPVPLRPEPCPAPASCAASPAACGTQAKAWRSRRPRSARATTRRRARAAPWRRRQAPRAARASGRTAWWRDAPATRCVALAGTAPMSCRALASR